MMRIKEKDTTTTMGDFTYVFGSDDLYRKFNEYDNRNYPSSADINALLYKGSVPSTVIGITKDYLISTEIITELGVGTSVFISNPTLVCGHFSGDQTVDTATYESVGYNRNFKQKDTAGDFIADDGNNYTLDKIRPESYGKYDQSAVFYTH
jgi:hypothetical protein